MVAVGVLRTEAGTPTALRRLQTLRDDLTAWVVRFRPDAIAVERVFADVNVATVMGNRAGGRRRHAVAADHGLPVGSHTRPRSRPRSPARAGPARPR